VIRGVAGDGANGEPRRDARRFSDELLAEAAKHPGAFVSVIDHEQVDDPLGEVPPRAIVGAWAVGEDGRPTGEYTANPNYRALGDDEER
jgi:hypothetical protein